MLRLSLIPLLCLCFFSRPANAQFTRRIDSLTAIYHSATSDSDKVVSCGKLAEYYFIYQLSDQGDSMLLEQLRIAELSQNKDLILIAFFGKAILNVSSWGKKGTFRKALEFVKKGLAYSKSIARQDYVALSYIRLSSLYLEIADLNNALYYATSADVSSQNIINDSIKILASIALGDVYQAKGESLIAFRTYSNAYENAVRVQNYVLQSEIYHRFAAVYTSPDSERIAEGYLEQSLELNRRMNNKEGLIKDYIDLARLTEDRTYIDMAISLSDSLHLDNYLLQAKKIMFGFYTYIIGNSDSTIAYLRHNPDLNQLFINIGMPYYYMNIGSLYHYAQKPDSAVYYLRLAQPGFERDFTEIKCQLLYAEIGECFALLNNPQMAILYYEKALALKSSSNNPQLEASYSSALSSLYEQEKDYKKAFYYAHQGTVLNDTLQKLSNQRDIVLMEVDNEKKKLENELELIAQQKRTKRNLQLMAITVLITVFFFLLVLMGMLRISKIAIKLLGYLGFISLFEFIVLLIDPFLKQITDDQPLKIWLLKILLIALLVPLQHNLEHRLILFLQSRKNKKNSGGNKSEPNPPETEENAISEMEKDTAVL
jgi:hypothetical protein